ncbi:MAG: Crp/Fnr family transcriptional regulator [Lachnospiraceae bacterium]|nr:Crp/Fnr family transcriptional regulator [Lachnospiraceae bacterium]MDD3795720.1 Crp/Fnr family transcriptional regulator [Lachnospiraceae bacterium]
MKLQDLWNSYAVHELFNASLLPEEIKVQGSILTYPPNTVLINRGDFPEYIYFLLSGIALGSRNYDDGTCYYYFSITRETGSVGLLEIMAHETKAIATIIAATPVTVLRIRSAVIYEYLMANPKMLHCCTYTIAHDLYQRSGNDGILYYQKGIDRVRYYLAQYYLTHFTGESLTVEADYQTIASNIGISVRTVVRSIQKLKLLGEVSSLNRKITITPEQHTRTLHVIQQLLHV